MKYQPPKYNNKELLEMFPEAKEIIPEKIREWEEKIKKKEKRIKDGLNFLYQQELDDFSVWFFEESMKVFLMPSIEKATKHILKLKLMRSTYTPGGKKLARWQEKLEIAREYPTETLARSKLDLRPAGNNFVSLCPFHNEKTPSFYIYPETNTFHCFGCQENGDNLNLTMYLYGVDFKEAVKMLQN